MRNRRNFLTKCVSLGAAGVGAHLTRLGLVSAHAQTTPAYKALVCVFFFGGNDSNNMVVPVDGRYGAYQALRGAVALPQGNLLAAGASGLGFHPNLSNFQRAFNATGAGQVKGAAVLNVGTLVRPTVKAMLNSTPLPRNLYSHSDQTQQWQSSDPNGGGSGWGGRVNDIAAIASQNTGAIPPGITVNGGNALFLSGPTSRGLNFSNSGSFGLQTFGDGASMNARLASLQRVLTFDTGLQLVSAANGVLADSIRSSQEINRALSSAPALPVTFPNSGLGQQLAQVARIMSVQGSLGINRQIFFAGMGGFDNHENLLANHANLMNTVNLAIGAFNDTMQAMALADRVTLFTESEFNRTGDSNANNGTDHAWGGHHAVFGGAVRNGAFGTLPDFIKRGNDDAGSRGNWIPTTSLDQYAATLAGWFGVPDSDLPSIFPNIVNFPTRRLGFL